jgi:hypothetical protein
MLRETEYISSKDREICGYITRARTWKAISDVDLPAELCRLRGNWSDKDLATAELPIQLSSRCQAKLHRTSIVRMAVTETSNRRS